MSNAWRLHASDLTPPNTLYNQHFESDLGPRSPLAWFSLSTYSCLTPIVAAIYNTFAMSNAWRLRASDLSPPNTMKK